MASVVIAGGGIAGVTTAIARQQQGVDASVYEAAPELRVRLRARPGPPAACALRNLT